jgi:tetratricopeptide (TPR) repeat protein
VEAYKQAISLKPDYAEAHSNLGVAYVHLDRYQVAVDEYKILRDLNQELANKLFNLIYK